MGQRRFFILTCRYGARLLSHPVVPLFAAIAAILLTLSTLTIGIFSDDEIHAAMLTPLSVLKDAGMVPADSHLFKNAVMTLYQFTGRGEIRKSLGLNFPWWADNEMAINFWRPLASASLWLDYRLWPQNPAIMHLENILWFAIAAFFAAIFYRRFVGGWAAGVAAILFVSNPEFPTVVAWIAARYAIMTLAFGAGAILFHHAWRSSGNKFAAVASWIMLVLSLLSGEGGAAAAGYILAYGLFYEKSNARSRIMSIIPAALIVVIWQISYKMLGYGAHYCLLYVDPVAEPMRYLASLIKNGPILFLNITGQIRTGFFMTLSPRLQNIVWIGAMAQWCAALAIFWPMLRTDRRAAFLLAGVLLSLIPACSSASPNERVLFFIGLGGMGLAALVIEAAVQGASWLTGRHIRRALVVAGAFLLIAMHAAYPFWVQVRMNIRGAQNSNVSKTDSRAIDLSSSAFGAGKNIVVVNSGEVFKCVAYTVPHRAHSGIDIPKDLGVLSGTYHNISITRPDSSTLVLQTPHGSLYPVWQLPENDIRSWPGKDPFYINACLASAFRIRERPFHPGDSVGCKGFVGSPWFSVKVNDVDARGVPSKAVFKFNRPLEDQSLSWVWWDWKTSAYYQFIPPMVGKTIVVPGRFFDR
jgi:hypothetical protein